MSPKKALQQNLIRFIQQFSIMRSIAGKGLRPLPAKNSGPIVTPPRGRSMSSKPDALKWKFWKKLSIFGAFPVIGAVGCSVMLSKSNEPVHVRPPFVKYEYMRKRTKRFPWGDGQKSFFHNPEINALPDGYEDEVQADE